MRSCRVDVVVVGAGPAGCAAATAAAEAGREVLLLERMFVPRDKPCGDGVASRAVAALQTMGVEERIRRRGYHPVLDYRLVSSWGAVSYTHLRAHETDSYLVCRLLLEKKK